MVGIRSMVGTIGDPECSPDTCRAPFTLEMSLVGSQPSPMIGSGCLVINTSNNNPTNQDTLAFTQRKLVENEVDRLHLPDLDVVPPERRGRRLQQRQLVLLGLAEDGVQVRQPGSHLNKYFLTQ